uniref:DUF3736 domain-containing protein n=1 Tax=Macrostomum lignano TaxID=282301 RepID=A0A1I8H463_9PLAT
KSAAAVAIVPCLGSGSAAVAEHAGGGGVGCVPVDSGAAGGAMPGAATNGADVTDSAAAASLAAPQAAVASANEYIGLGRWNCHLKVWFDERHILRNVNVQLTEQRYCQPRAIARQFVEDQVCGTQDEEALARRIAFAFLGHPTQNGRVRDYQELCTKLGWAQPPSPQPQPQQQLDTQSSSERTGTSRQASRDYPAGGGGNGGGAGSSGGGNNRGSPPVSAAPTAAAPPTAAAAPAAAPTVAPATVAAAPGQPQNPLLSHQLDCDLLSRKLDALAKQRQEAEERQRLRDCTYERICAGPRQPNHDDVDCVLVPVEAPPSELFWGCGPTCRSYRECRWHDKCDYLSRSDLPNYLTARCYHCREQLAKESGVDAFTLWWLHSQNRVPYPYFLQVRFGYPLEPVTQEDIRYECRFRGRRPCRCLRDKRTGRVLELPPCTEFPEDYVSDGEDPAAAAAATTKIEAPAGRGGARRGGGGQQKSSVTSRCWISRYMEERKRRQRRNSSCAGWQQFYGHRKHNSF